MAEPVQPGKTGVRPVLRLFWSNTATRIGLSLVAVQFVMMSVLAVYHSVTPSGLPEDATVGQVWRAIPPAERGLVIAGFGVFIVGALVFGVGFRRALRNSA